MNKTLRPSSSKDSSRIKTSKNDIKERNYDPYRYSKKTAIKKQVRRLNQ